MSDETLQIMPKSVCTYMDFSLWRRIESIHQMTQVGHDLLKSQNTKSCHSMFEYSHRFGYKPSQFFYKSVKLTTWAPKQSTNMSVPRKEYSHPDHD